MRRTEPPDVVLVDDFVSGMEALEAFIDRYDHAPFLEVYRDGILVVAKTTREPIIALEG